MERQSNTKGSSTTRRQSSVFTDIATFVTYVVVRIFCLLVDTDCQWLLWSKRFPDVSTPAFSASPSLRVSVCSEIQQTYRTLVVSHIVVVLNTCLSVAVGLVVWFRYEPPPEAASTIVYGVVGGLQLWLCFFANVLLLVGKASARSSHHSTSLYSSTQMVCGWKCWLFSWNNRNILTHVMPTFHPTRELWRRQNKNKDGRRRILGTPCLFNYETTHLGLCFYHISKLTCTIIVLTTSYKFLSFCYICCTDDVLEFLSYFLNFILSLCFVLVVYCGAPMPRMRGALANDTIWYMIWYEWH